LDHLYVREAEYSFVGLRLSMSKILIVDDDVELASAIERVFKAAGWSTEKVHTGADALQFLTKFKFDLVILDWNLPDMSGPNICQQFRTSGGETPIMFLTGRNTIPDKELGLDSGGDEYITKPFENRELLARARAMLRRPALSAEAPIINGVQLDPRGKSLIAGDKKVQLSSTEFMIVQFLFKNAGTFFTAIQLYEALWPADAESTSEVVRYHINVLRRKLSLLGFRDLIKTVRGAGYIIELPKQAEGPTIP
jgi:two-component system, OmpR family, manganese sensing response regulator